MTLMRYKPLANDLFAPFRAFEEAMTQHLNENPVSASPWTPAVDILENEHAVVLKADLPEVNEKDIEVKLENGTLTLKGQRKFERESTEKGGYHRIERAYGSFLRYFTVPDTLDAEKVKADYRNGVLTVTLPKKEIAKPRTIPVAINAN